VATTTTAVTTTTTVGGAVPTNPTFPTTTSSTTTTLAAPDLTPTDDGPERLVLFDQNTATYTVTVENVGNAPTAGPMAFTVTLPFSAVGNNGALLLLDPSAGDPSTAEWTVVEDGGTFGSPGSPGVPTVLNITSATDFVLTAGATSTLTFTLQLLLEDVAEFSVDVELPPGIGGETNGTNNTASLAVTIDPPQPPA
jgi:hypothetical protein